MRQTARRRVGRAGSGQFHYRRERQPQPSGEEQEVQVSEGGRKQAAESGGKRGVRAAPLFARKAPRLLLGTPPGRGGGVPGGAETGGNGARGGMERFFLPYT